MKVGMLSVVDKNLFFNSSLHRIASRFVMGKRKVCFEIELERLQDILRNIRSLGEDI